MRIVLPKPGTYVVAVSGGVDSMALLHLLQQHEGYTLVVAHLDHGIREDSADDRRLVQQTARDYGLPFVYYQAELGPNTSEDQARQVRYEFLETVRSSSNARAIITGHHQDDVLETAIHNIARGTGRRGLTSLNTRPGFERPLLEVPKQQLREHAEQRQLAWREDSTNRDVAYTRNYIRHRVVPRIDAEHTRQLYGLLRRMRLLNTEIDRQLDNLLHEHSVHSRLDRQWFIQLDHSLAKEVLAAWLRFHCVNGFDAKTIERLTIAAKVATPGSHYDVLNKVTVHVWLDSLALQGHER